jgi:hypothetical protein
VRREHFAYFPEEPRALTLWFLARSPTSCHTGRCGRYASGESGAGPELGLLPIWRGKHGLERSLELAGGLQVPPGMGHGSWSIIRDLLSPCYSKLSSAGSSSLIAESSSESPTWYDTRLFLGGEGIDRAAGTCLPG